MCEIKIEPLTSMLSIDKEATKPSHRRTEICSAVRQTGKFLKETKEIMYDKSKNRKHNFHCGPKTRESS